jgi:hypothetical protein
VVAQTATVAALLAFLSATEAVGQVDSLDAAASHPPAERILLQTGQTNQSLAVQRQVPSFVPEGFCCPEPKFAPAIGITAALQVIPNYFNWRVTDDSTAILSLEAFKYNVTHGFEWDHNNFTTNMFMHPYHGSVYYNAGRANGYDFWSSSVFAAFGSFIWEMFGENNRGAVNDWVNTTLGGIAIGESLNRSARMLRDNEARGAGRSLREFGAFLVDPITGFSRAARGETSKVGANPADRFPDSGGMQLTTGLRRVGNEKRDPSPGRPQDPSNTPYMDLTIAYGDFLRDFERPFDAFRFAVQVNFGDTTPIGRMTIRGSLWGKSLRYAEGIEHTVTFDHEFNYLETTAAEFAGQFFGPSLFSRWKLSETFTVATHVQPLFAALTGINSQHDHETGRSYDFGTGAAIQLDANLLVKGYPVIRLMFFDVFSATINGAKGYHNIAIPVIQGRFPLTRVIGIGFDWWTLQRNSWYEDFQDFGHASPTLRINVAFSWFKRRAAAL